MLSSAMKCYHLGCNVIIWSQKGTKCYHLELLLWYGANGVTWSLCYHLVLSCDVIIWDDNTPLFIFPENFTHSYKALPYWLLITPVIFPIKNLPCNKISNAQDDRWKSVYCILDSGINCKASSYIKWNVPFRSKVFFNIHSSLTPYQHATYQFPFLAQKARSFTWHLNRMSSDVYNRPHRRAFTLEPLRWDIP